MGSRSKSNESPSRAKRAKGLESPKTKKTQLASVLTERFGFAVPAAYARMAEAGLLSYGKSRDDWRKRWRSIVLESPPALATSDLEWLSADEIVARVERYGGRPRWRPTWPSDFVFVPFATNAAGDEWGWAPSVGEPGSAEAPVVYIAHDAADARVVAPTFASFMFRMALEALAVCSYDPAIPLAERVAALRGSTRRVLDFLPAELAARLDRVLDRPVRKVIVRTLREKDGKFFRASEAMHLSLVSEEWAARVVRDELEVDQVLRFDT